MVEFLLDNMVTVFVNALMDTQATTVKTSNHVQLVLADSHVKTEVHQLDTMEPAVVSVLKDGLEPIVRPIQLVQLDQMVCLVGMEELSSVNLVGVNVFALLTLEELTVKLVMLVLLVSTVNHVETAAMQLVFSVAEELVNLANSTILEVTPAAHASVSMITLDQTVRHYPYVLQDIMDKFV